MNQQNTNANQIMMSRPGMESVPLGIQEVLSILQQQQEHIQKITNELSEKDQIILKLQKQIIEKSRTSDSSSDVKSEPSISKEVTIKKNVVFSKLIPEVKINVSD
jgi:hypothetical protein